jgi:hypothetical protein
MHDLRSRRARELFEDGETRFRTARVQRMTAYGAAIGAAAIILAWMLPPYRELCHDLHGRAVALINIGIPVGVALAAIAVFDQILPARRYPFLATLPPPDRD